MEFFIISPAVKQKLGDAKYQKYEVPGNLSPNEPTAISRTIYRRPLTPEYVNSIHLKITFRYYDELNNKLTIPAPIYLRYKVDQHFKVIQVVQLGDIAIKEIEALDRN